MQWLHSPINKLWCVIVFLLIVLFRPIGVEVLGGIGLVTSHKAALVGFSSESGKTEESGYQWSDGHYQFKLKDGGYAHITISEQVKSSNITDADNVDLGFALGEIATINGEFVAPVGPFELMLFAWTCPLLTVAVMTTVIRHRHRQWAQISSQDAAGYAIALPLAAVPVAMPAFFASLILSLMGIVAWPFIAIGAYVMVGLLLGYRAKPPRPKALGSQ